MFLSSMSWIEKAEGAKISMMEDLGSMGRIMCESRIGWTRMRCQILGLLYSQAGLLLAIY